MTATTTTTTIIDFALAKHDSESVFDVRSSVLEFIIKTLDRSEYVCVCVSQLDFSWSSTQTYFEPIIV